MGESYQVVPKKSGITVVQNERGEEVATHPYFRLEGHPFYCFLDGYSGYFQIEIDVEDQENATFTCHLEHMLTEECLLVCEMHLQHSKDKGIVLGHIISKKGIEVDKAKVELIIKLPSPTTVKGVRQFLGHARFYRRFIKDFSKLSKPLCELLLLVKFQVSGKHKIGSTSLQKFMPTIGKNLFFSSIVDSCPIGVPIDSTQLMCFDLNPQTGLLENHNSGVGGAIRDLTPGGELQKGEGRAFLLVVFGAEDIQRGRSEFVRGGASPAGGFIGAAGGGGAVQKGKLVGFVDIGGGFEGIDS
ncbi:Retrovirus-related Pol polyprotein from transposon opus [Vitis vinifera]|uniref:Retrovirus-related Pol polyprotein from transposon opus n=1 Tax=Vitis vinifera TaxID=29760 RepID=A0A438GIT8_VITVI|nr:Retrovirus-related Pol polyprotein from transposon opus [Vitis vinifera]